MYSRSKPHAEPLPPSCEMVLPSRAVGDCSSVQDQLKNVQQIQASDAAFAAVLGDGSVVAWGRASYGVDSRSVQDQLKEAFAAILGDGSVVAWGSADSGGDSSSAQGQLRNA